MSFYPHRSEALEAIARKIISQYDPCLLDAPAPIPVEDIMENVYGLTMEFQYIRKNGRILGETVFEDTLVPIYERRNREGYKMVTVKAGTVIIDVSLIDNRNDGRYRYTCAHELAHWVIDKDYFRENVTMAAMTDKADKSSETGANVERQADRMASCILMPKGTIKRAFYNNFNRKRDITAYMADLFEVSQQAMGIRLTAMGLLY